MDARIVGIISAFVIASCGKQDVEPVASKDVSASPADTAESAAREKVLALAVASECMRRTGVSQSQTSHAMLSLYRAHGIDLETYTHLMTKLGADPTFTAEVERLTRECPAAPPPDTATPDTVTPDTATPDTATLDTATLADTGPADSGPADTLPAATDAGPTHGTDSGHTPDTRDTSKPERDLSGTWTGPLAGPVAGTLRVTIAGRSIKDASATFGRLTFKLKGSISDNDSLMLAGKQGVDFLRLNGKLEGNGKSFGGPWNGVVDRKRAEGRFRIVR